MTLHSLLSAQRKILLDSACLSQLWLGFLGSVPMAVPISFAWDKSWDLAVCTCLLSGAVEREASLRKGGMSGGLGVQDNHGAAGD